MKRVIVTGYKSHELGIFSNNHPGISFIKLAIQRRLISMIETGLEWMIISGQPGVELWAAEVLIELRQDYPQIKFAVITPFLDQEKNWNEERQSAYEFILSEADFVDSVTKREYEGPWQFKERNKFLLRNSDGILLVYDDEKPGTPKYIYSSAQKLAETGDYQVMLINGYDLQLIAEEEQLKEWN